MSTDERKSAGRHFHVDFTGVESSRVQEALKHTFYSILEFHPRTFSFWPKLESGKVAELPQRMLVLADLSNIVKAWRSTEQSRWKHAMRTARPFVVAFVRSKRDMQCAGVIDDLMKVCDMRLEVCQYGKNTLNQCLTRAVKAIDPESILNIRYSALEESFWIEFGDGLTATIKRQALALEDRKPALHPETVCVNTDDPETVEILDDKGHKFEIDAASLRALVDADFRRRLSSRTSDVLNEIGARLRNKRTGKRVTQKELQKRTGLEQALISKLERGRHQPRLDTLRKYASGLGLSLSELLTA